MFVLWSWVEMPGQLGRERVGYSEGGLRGLLQ